MYMDVQMKAVFHKKVLARVTMARSRIKWWREN